MSHVEDGKLRVRDTDALDEVLREHPELGLELRIGQRTFGWWGNFVGDSVPPPGRDPRDYGKCEHAIGRKGHVGRNGSNGEWEIGLVPALDGDGYDLMFDAYGGQGQRLASALPTLRREYAVKVATRRIEKQLGRKFKVERVREGSKTRLKVRKR